MILNIPLFASGASELTDNDGLQLTTLRQAPKTTGRNGWRVVEEEVLWQPSETGNCHRGYVEQTLVMGCNRACGYYGTTNECCRLIPLGIEGYRLFTHRQIRWISTTGTPRGLGSLMSRI